MIKVAIIGASRRVRAFVKSLKADYAENYRLVGLMDIEAGKMRAFNESLEIDIPCFTDFDQMCRETQPDLLLVTTVDYYHRDYIVQALDRQISCICEKPLCVNIGQCRDIIEAQARNPKVFAATSHNARYHIAARTVKQLLDEGAIGKVNSAYYAEMLGWDHGSSYFRRWNRQKALSGGLQIHKSSHHFDKLNWWLNSKPVEVTATGELRCYGPKASPFHGENCHTCPHIAKCPLPAEISKNNIDFELFAKYATEGSYLPDKCVFSPEIDSEDFLSVGIKYANGVGVNYSLAAHCNIAGEDIFFEGDKGRIEMRRRSNAPASVLIYRDGVKEPENIELAEEAGSHGGADKRLFEDLFGNASSGRLATLEDGIQAVLVGIAVNESLKNGSKIDVQSLL